MVMTVFEMLGVAPRDGIRTFRVLVTPEMAEKILRECNIGNRKPSQSYVKKYSSDQSKGYWCAGSVICFYDSGLLADGQHRLLAVVESGVPTEFVFHLGTPDTPQGRRQFNQGKADNLADLLKRSLGVDSVYGVTTQHASRYIRTLCEIEKNRKVITVNETDELIQVFSKGLSFIAPFCASNKKGIGRSACWAAIIGASYYFDQEKLKRFCEIFIGAENSKSESESVAMRLSNDLLKATDLGATDRRATYLKTQRAIKAFMNGEPLKKIVCPASFLYKAFDAIENS